MAHDVDTIVVGAGVVGLAIARALALAGLEVVLVEAESTFGTHGSSRNSEVIHAGIYYAPGSLKARLCRLGKHLLYDYCEHRNVPYRRLGKLIVATTAGEVETLHQLRDNARRCGLDDLSLLERDEVHALEPALSSHGALLSPSTGIVDSHTLMVRLLADFEGAGGQVAWSTPVDRIGIDEDGFTVTAADTRVACRQVVNAAGLGAQAVARATEGLPADTIPDLYLCKGTYASLCGPHPFSRLVYPTPSSASLGVHLTLDLAGQARFGPDQLWIDELDYTADPSRLDGFAASIRRYWPQLDPTRLRLDYTGIRAKVQAPGGPAADFVVQGCDDHGVTGLVNLYGIESPGLTACLALAQQALHQLGLGPAPLETP